MSQNSVFLNKDTIHFKNEENEIIDNFNKENFIRDIQRLGVDLENLDKNSNDLDKQVFNWILNKLNSDYNYNLYECILYLEKDYIPFKKLFNLLDDSNKQILKEELSKKYNIKIMRTKLSKFFIK